MDPSSRQDKVPSKQVFIFHFWAEQDSLTRVNLFFIQTIHECRRQCLNFVRSDENTRKLTHSSKGLLVSEQIIKQSTNWVIVNTKAT